MFASAEDFLGSDILDKTTCLIVLIFHMPVMTGLELQCQLCQPSISDSDDFIDRPRRPDGASQGIEIRRR